MKSVDVSARRKLQAIVREALNALMLLIRPNYSLAPTNCKYTLLSIIAVQIIGGLCKYSTAVICKQPYQTVVLGKTSIWLLRIYFCIYFLCISVYLYSYCLCKKSIIYFLFFINEVVMRS